MTDTEEKSTNHKRTGLAFKIRLGKREGNFQCCGYGSWSVFLIFLLINERIRIREAQKLTNPKNPDTDPEHW
jgi:hypothetical protein